jgi:hypothetical protein
MGCWFLEKRCPGGRKSKLLDLEFLLSRGVGDEVKVGEAEAGRGRGTSQGSAAAGNIGS